MVDDLKSKLPSLPSVPSQAPLADEHVKRQLSGLFGESLFGAWPELAASQRAPVRRRGARRWLPRLAIVFVVVAAVWGGRALLQPGLVRQDDAVRENYAEQLQSFLTEGDLERVGQYLRLVTGGGAAEQGLSPNDPHRPLVAAAEAALYRYFDAEPARLDRLRPLLNGPRSTPQQRVAAFTVLSREERAAGLAELERLSQELTSNEELEHLRATALAFRGETEDSREAWGRAAKLGPAWLVHRFEQAAFEMASGDAEAAKRVTTEMLRIDPDSAWSKLAQASFGVAAPVEAAGARGGARSLATAPVAVFVEKLREAVALASGGAVEEARGRLRDALTQIHHQPPFLLDAFDELLAEKQWALLRELTTLEAWPRSSAVAESKMRRLAQAQKAGERP